MLNKLGKDIILISLGFSRTNIQSLFNSQGMIIGFIGISLGVILGIVLSTEYKCNCGISRVIIKICITLMNPNIYHLDTVPSTILISDVYKIIIVSSLMVLLSSVYPARKATNIVPSQSLNQ